MITSQEKSFGSVGCESGILGQFLKALTPDLHIVQLSCSWLQQILDSRHAQSMILERVDMTLKYPGNDA